MTLLNTARALPHGRRGSRDNGRARMSVREIAERTGVSVATVSRVLNNKPNVSPDTRDRILTAINDTGYVPRVGRRDSNVIGLVYAGPDAARTYGDFDSAVLAGVLQATRERHYDLKIIDLERDWSPAEAYTQFFIRKGLAGVILRTTEARRHICRTIAEEGFPHIVVAENFGKEPVNYIYSESKANSKRAIQHLLHLGHTRIGLAVHSEPASDLRDRAKAYEETITDAGLQVDPHLMVQIFADPAGGASAVNELLCQPDPATAIYFTNPLSMLGALRRCAQLGVRVPEELSIVGFDDSDVRTHVFPPCTAVCQDARALGQEAAAWLMRMLSGSESPVCQRVVPTAFEINQSTSLRPAEPVRILADGTRVASGAS